MSLIYDYLKIYGKSNSVSDSDVEIPPTLKSRDSSRLNNRFVLQLLGFCLIGIFFILLIIRIFTPGQNMQEAADSVSSSPAPQVQQEQSQSPVDELQSTLQQHDGSVDSTAAEPVFSAPPNFAASKKATQVFPETEKPEIKDASASPRIESIAAEPSGAIKNTSPQPLELVSRNSKRISPEEIPIYTEADKSATNAVPAFPFHRDVVVQKDFRGFSSNPASQDKSRKLYQAALQAQHSGDHRIAEIYYKKVLEGMPGHMEAMINLSALYVQQERYIEAEEVLAVILSIDPTNSKGLVNMGMINLYQNNETLAEAQFKAALDANPAEENALINLAYLAEKRRDYASTERYYNDLLQISPDNLQVLLAYGHLLEEEKRYPEAVDLYRDCLELDTVKKDQQLHGKISRRVRLLAGVTHIEQP